MRPVASLECERRRRATMQAGWESLTVLSRPAAAGEERDHPDAPDPRRPGWADSSMENACAAGRSRYRRRGDPGSRGGYRAIWRAARHKYRTGPRDVSTSELQEHAKNATKPNPKTTKPRPDSRGPAS